jgi:hypothetical protein
MTLVRNVIGYRSARGILAVLVCAFSPAVAVAGGSGLPVATGPLWKIFHKCPFATGRPLSPEQDVGVTAPAPVYSSPRPSLNLSRRRGRPSADGSPQRLSKTEPYHAN